MSLRLSTRRSPLQEVQQLVAEWHRHMGDRPPIQIIAGFAVYSGQRGALWGEEIRGVACVEPARSRVLALQGWLEVTRCATDGTPNACSALYGACRRWAMKHRPGSGLVTYTLATEPGTSLLAAGWVDDGPAARGGDWTRGSSVRRPAKRRWIGLPLVR